MLPDESWTLNDWVVAVGGPTNREIQTEAYTLDQTEGWSDASLSRLMAADAALDDHKAKVMLAILRRIAHRNRKILFSDNRLEQDARCFLLSRACKAPYHLTEDILRFIIGNTDAKRVYDPWASLRRMVQPPPPFERRKLFGREQDIQHVLHSLVKEPVVAIDGIAGEGKTSLAWFAALDAVEGNLVSNVDWVTDKRYVLEIATEQHTQLKREPLDFIGILHSMVSRFRWYDLYGINDLDELQAGCAHFLRNGYYLVVIDNLESIEDSDLIIRFFMDMLAPVHRLSHVTSRLLITSREYVYVPGCQRVNLEGIENNERVPYIRSLEYYNNPLLSDNECEKLAELTDGNPLFLQIAMHAYNLSPNIKTFEEIIANLGDGVRSRFELAFENLFGGLLAKCGEDAIWLATYAAMRSLTRPVENDDLHRAWEIRSQEIESHTTYQHIINVLVNNRVLNSVVGTSLFNIHSLIRAYLIRHISDD